MCSLPSSSTSEATQSNLHKWYFTKEEAANTASIREHGFTPEKELTYRQQATRFIQLMVDQLNHNVRDQRGKIILYKFGPILTQDIAAACLFLAGKSEECPRKLDHIVRVWWAKKFERHPTIPSNNVTLSSKVMLSITLLSEKCVKLAHRTPFDLKVEMPHPFVLAAMHEIAPNEILMFLDVTLFQAVCDKLGDSVQRKCNSVCVCTPRVCIRWIRGAGQHLFPFCLERAL
ncbi:hypothetical protein DICVIV_10494 [Dictyocaulus viviparus]|uniref:Cyclin N-terminal domain-containing protein n=1 Tax=Dictyocaulus viviparus TaxID=29172 RepID=A0A0D8XFW9_DICVI|nr:hypothetical protein DICVIV_10494 [Dictyocaulus viviparus]